MTKAKIFIVPGNGDSHIETDNWYAWVRDELIKRGYEVVARDMPDPEFAHMNIWLPYIEKELRADENTVLIGHSSGAVAALRYLETHKLKGVILVGACYSDLGDANERESGYYTAPWKWDAIKENAEWIVQFASTDDPYIPISQARFIREQLDSEYYEYSDRGHFMTGHGDRGNVFPEIIDVVVTQNSR